MECIKTYIASWRWSRPTSTHRTHTDKIEKYQPGYPRFAALISSHAPFFLCRRFSRLRARVLLKKQDRLSMLEERLDEIDDKETSLLFLGKSRIDKNAARLSLLEDIESALADYGECSWVQGIKRLEAKSLDKFTEDSRRMLSLDAAESRDMASLQNWLDGTGCIARDESAYIKHSREMACLSPCGDSALVQLEAWVETKLTRVYRGFRQNRDYDLSTDPNVYLYSGQIIKRIARALLLFLITTLLLMPVVICNMANSTTVRLIIIVISTICYLFILSEMTKSRTIELVLAGATYATVLIVFVSGANSM
ncbi:hypothetical protein BU25DRAFT_72116 [Macroventuria anomochaeta]|uniref:Uncharacterized protein n=1 Tax=Macroventuria anomochaeta TaxID=301207 RepID=A0ACB6RYE2_9PLEO|nr:uncharacterized protein BU25DRAFT_72116 [Macroventuria anomochaeta]KAF2626793.1 hypothetical protein BU25DRAFT_72116 [Macroventuria anomochaeta]